MIHPTKIQVRQSNLQTSPTNNNDLQATLGEAYISKADCVSTHFITLMMKAEMVSEQTDVFNHPTWLSARDFIDFCCHEFKNIKHNMPDIKANNKLKVVRVSKESMKKKLSKFSKG